MPSIYYANNFYLYEEQLPMLYIIFNDRKNITYNEQYTYLYQNQQTFITAYDIYNTVSNLVYGDKYSYIKNKTQNIDTPKSKFGISLLEKINQKERTSKNYENMYSYVCE